MPIHHIIRRIFPPHRGLPSIGDSAYRAALLKQIRLPSVALEVMGLFFLLLAYPASPGYLYEVRIEFAACASGMLLGICIGYFSKTTFRLNVGALFCTIAASCGFRLITAAAGQSLHWVLPIGAIMTMAIAGTASSPLFFLTLVGAVWLILGTGLAPDVMHAYGNWAVVFMLSSVIVGLILCFIFMRLRYGNFVIRHRLEKMAYTDFLTGIPNRRFFLEHLQKTVAGSSQQHFLLMLDVDNFKKINDRLGHEVGDSVLKAVAQAIAEAAQSQPHGRLGGEEFGLVHAGDEASASQFARRVLAAIRALNLGQTNVTASVGMTRIKADSINHSFQEADQALYIAKSLGKDQASVWRP